MPRIQIDSRPTYFRGQLLLEDDFDAEQRWHLLARCGHNLRLHGWGVVSGLEVAVRGAALVVAPGCAIDAQGREIALADEVEVGLADAAPGATVSVTLDYVEDGAADGEPPRNRIACRAVVEASAAPADARRLVLATVRLDERGRPQADSVDAARVRRVRVVPSPGSVDAQALHDSLRRGWLRMPFRPIPLEKGPVGEQIIPPPFRVGATECRSYDDWEGKKNDRGAGGTMALALPAGARSIHRFTIAGRNNAAGIDLKLVSGGWDPQGRTHRRQALLAATVTGEPYEQTFQIDDGAIDPQYHTLSVWLLGHGKTSVSLVAVELGY